jgi:thymidine kinase
MSLTLVIGCMFSGKSSYLLSCIRAYKEIGSSIFIITSNLDKRYSDEPMIVNHSKESFKADIAVDDLFDAIINTGFLQAKVIIIEEAQFHKNLADFVVMAVDIHEKHVIVAGLDGDANRNPFGEVLNLVPLADNIVKLKAICKKCSDENLVTDALFSSKIINNSSSLDLVDVGGSDKYESLCRKHYIENNLKN